MEAPREYEPPKIETIGTVEDLTQVNKDYGSADGGITFQTQPTTIVS